MPYLVDGHNLIPKIPGLSLRAMDDENRLIELLQEFCRVQRKQAEVFFDNAPPGQTGARRFGLVSANFVRRGRTADDAIRARLARLGKQARNWTVVSSDLAVQNSARLAQAQVVSSEEFSAFVMKAMKENSSDHNQEPLLSKGEVDEWLALFGDEPEEG